VLLKKVRWLTMVLVLLGLLGGCGAEATPAPVGEPALALSECQLSMPNVNATLSARCGTLEVLEDYGNPAGRRLELNIAVVSAVSRNPEPDPVFILAGGPGQAVVEIYPALRSSFSRVRQTRDIVLVDQRGTGQSHPLKCDIPEAETVSQEVAVDALQACPGTLDADLRFYTTEIAMRDLDAVREALGYETINLYGVSYGTRAALTYMRNYPTRVRSAVLDSAVSPDYRLYMNTGQDADLALGKLFDRCAADEACHGAFPDAREAFAALLERLELEPVTSTVPDPVSTEPVTLTVTREMLLNLTFPLLYSPELAALVPLSLQQAAGGDFAPLAAQAVASGGNLYLGMFYAVACTEDAPFITPAEAGALAAGTLFGDRTGMLLEVCTAWPRGELSAGFDAPVTSDAPVLLLSGEADPVTPPHYAARIAQTLPHSLHVIGPGMGHGLTGRGCVDALVANFIAAGSPEGLDVACVQQMVPPPFFLTPLGPAP
jgi:pimeloyl-ACP methyl ester carboxylesterase